MSWLAKETFRKHKAPRNGFEAHMWRYSLTYSFVRSKTEVTLDGALQQFRCDIHFSTSVKKLRIHFTSSLSSFWNFARADTTTRFYPSTIIHHPAKNNLRDRPLRTWYHLECQTHSLLSPSLPASFRSFLSLTKCTLLWNESRKMVLSTLSSESILVIFRTHPEA